MINWLIGSNGNDTLLGSITDDIIYGLEGDDVLRGNNGDDKLLGGLGDDSLTGGAGDDTLDGGDGHDSVTESGNVDFTVTNGSLVGRGTDVLISIESLHLVGGDSGNRIDASDVTDFEVIIEGGAGEDTIFGGHNTSIFGQSGNDILYTLGDSAYTFLDAISGLSGDILDGGTGNDTIHSASFYPGEIFGGDGNDLIRGGGYLYGNAGNDVIYARGKFVIDAGAGDDNIYAYEDLFDDHTVRSGVGHDQIHLYSQGGCIYAHGGEGNDILSDYSYQGRGYSDHKLLGGFGNDIIKGGRFLYGADEPYSLIFKGIGNVSSLNSIDTLIGTNSPNNFVLGINFGVESILFYDDMNPLTIGTKDYALITNFDALEDRIHLSGSADDYYLAETTVLGTSGTGIFHHESQTVGELIAIVQTYADLDINNSRYFDFERRWV